MSKSRCFAITVTMVFVASWARAEVRRGVVLTAEGSPASGARVWAAKLWTSTLMRVDTKADDQGRFGVNLGPGQWIVQASLGNLGLEQMDVMVSEGRANRPLILRLSPQGHLRARLTEAETGKPIAGGRLMLDNGLDPTTDDDGWLEVEGLSHAKYHEAFVVAPGRERKRILFEMAEGPETVLELAVARGARAIGRVLDLDGRPIPGARIGRSTSGSWLSLTGLWIKADDAGRFDYDGLPLARTTWLNAGAEGFQGGERSDVRADPGGGPITIEFHLARDPVKTTAGAGGAVAKPAGPHAKDRRNVSGVVLDPGMKPIAGAKVRWGAAQTDETIETKTSDDGSFTLALVPDQPEAVCVIPESSSLAPDISQVTQKGDQQLHIVLTPGRTARGVVCDDRGAPFHGVTVLPEMTTSSGSILALWERSMKTDREGRFQIDGLPDSEVMFTFAGQGVNGLRNQALKLDQENTVVMWASGAIRGKVVDHDGQPVRNFRVLLNAPRQRKPDDKHGGFFAGFCGIGLSYTSSDGVFVVHNLAGGSVQRVTVLAPGHGEGTIDRVIAEPSSHQSPADPLVFRLPPPNALRVHVIEDPSGKPVANASVGLIFDNPGIDQNFEWGYHDIAWGDSVHARTDDQGVATFSPLSFSEATVTVRADDFVRRHLGWRDRSTELTIKLTRAAVVSGELLDARTGKPLDGVHVNLQSPSGGRSDALDSGDAGRFRLGELEAGSYLFSITNAADLSLYHEPITLAPGQHVHRTLRLVPTRP